MNTLALHAEAIKERVAPRQAAERYGLTFNHANAALCPFHHEKTPSLKDMGRYLRCFGCGWFGDSLDLTGKLFDLSLEETIEKLDKDFSLNLPIDRRLTFREQREAEARIREIATRRDKAAAERIAHERLYDSLHDELARLERNAMLYAPQSAEDEWDERFCEALRKLPDVQFQIDILL